MKLEQMLNSSGTSDLAVYDSQINTLRGDVTSYKAKYDSNLTASNNWSKPAWEDSESRWRKGKLDVFITGCVRKSRTDNPCIVDNQTGRKDRYQDRLAKARNYYHIATDALAARNASQALLDDVIQKKSDYEAALADGASKGLDSTQVSEIYKQELGTIKAEQDAIAAQVAAAERAASESGMTKYYIIGGVALVGLIAFFALRKKK